MSWLHIEDEDGIRRVTFDRPERKNAIPSDGWAYLQDVFTEFDRSGPRVLVLTGEGGDFCAGADLDQMTSDGAASPVADLHRRMKLVGEAVTALHRVSKPTIAAVDGVAVGAGMNLALACDVVVASDRARFSEIFVRRGLTVDAGGTWLLPRIVGMQRAKELVLSGRVVEADEARALGIAMETVAAASLVDRAQQIARGFLEGAPIAQMLAKQGINTSFESSFEEAVSWEGQSQVIAFASEDAVEGISAFIDKRHPVWKGR